MSVLVGSGADLFGIQVAGAANPVCWCVQFFTENDGIDFGSGANIDDLPLGDCTIEGWFLIPVIPPPGTVNLIAKASAANNGWTIYVDSTFGILSGAVRFSANNVQLNSAPLAMAAGIWHHIAIDWDVGTLTGRLFLDGVLQASDGGAGIYQTAAAIKCIVNGYNSVGTGDQAMTVGWIHLSSTRRYTGASFDPGERNIYPTPDANTQLLAYMADGAGVTATDESGNGYDGTITFGAHTQWVNDPV